jgi:hypothetical protein
MDNSSVARLNNYKQRKKFGDTFLPRIAQVSLCGGRHFQFDRPRASKKAGIVAGTVTRPIIRSRPAIIDCTPTGRC